MNHNNVGISKLYLVLHHIMPYHIPSWVIDWDTVFRLGHSPIQAVHNMLCTAWIGGCPNINTALCPNSTW